MVLIIRAFQYPRSTSLKCKYTVPAYQRLVVLTEDPSSNLSIARRSIVVRNVGIFWFLLGVFLKFLPKTQFSTPHFMSFHILIHSFHAILHLFTVRENSLVWRTAGV